MPLFQKWRRVLLLPEGIFAAAVMSGREGGLASIPLPGCQQLVPVHDVAFSKNLRLMREAC
jgi:hypothetical protein